MAKNIKLMWINYPHMPTGADFDEKKLNELIFWTKKNNIILIGDSILENSNYVEKYFSVESSIKKKHYKVINLAQDNAVIEQVSTQIKYLQQQV